jgi:hypothetical protein
VSPRTSGFRLPISVHLLPPDSTRERLLELPRPRTFTSFTSRLLPCRSFPCRTLLNPFSFSSSYIIYPFSCPPHRSFHSHSLATALSLIFSRPIFLSRSLAFVLVPALSLLLVLSFFPHPILPPFRLGSLSLPELIRVPLRASVARDTVATTCNAVVNQYSEAVTTTGHHLSPSTDTGRSP